MELADKIIERQEQIGEPPDEWETIDILRGRLLCFSQILDDKAKLMNIVEVAQETQAMNWQPVFETFFLEDMGIPMEAFIKFIQENGYKPTLGLDWLYMGTDEEGIEQYAYISHYIEFFKINGVM